MAARPLKLTGKLKKTGRKMQKTKIPKIK